jgi:hypothetical protein
MASLPEPPATPAARLRTALALFADGVNIMRENLRRSFPGESQEQIGRRLRAWLRERPLPGEGEREFRPRRERP